MANYKRSWRYLFIPLAIAAAFGIYSFRQPLRKLESIQRELFYGANSFDVSDDGRVLAVGADTDQRDDASLLLMLNSQSLYFTGISARVSQRVSPIEFVSDEFGFLLGCSIDPFVAGREEWPIVPGRLERFSLDGSRKVIVDSVPSPISSLSISADRKLVAVCSDASGDFSHLGQCNVYSLEDGTLKSTFRPAEAFRLRAVFTGEKGECLIVREIHGPSPLRAWLIAGETGEVLHEANISDRGMQLHALVGSSETGEAFVATDGEIGRFKVKDGKFEFEERFYVGRRPYWMDYHAGTGRLAVSVSNGGTNETLSVRIVDVKTQTAFETLINSAGPLKFAPDGKSLYILGLGVQKYFLDQLR